MIMRMFAILLALQGGRASDTYFQFIAKLSSGVGNTFAAIAVGSADVWNKLATPQAKRILRDLSSDAETLYGKNKSLESDVEKRMRNHSERELDIDPRIKDLRDAATKMSERLEKFRHEVDQAVGTEVHFRGNTERAFGAKADRLQDVADSWHAGKYQDAWIALSDAERSLQRAQNGIVCMKESIDAGKTVCDKDTLERK
jgi:hypothetical protein